MHRRGLLLVTCRLLKEILQKDEILDSFYAVRLFLTPHFKQRAEGKA
jgi:hypothetical protein